MKLTNKDVQINIHEVKRPELDAQLVAANVAHQIEGKIAYRRAVKMAWVPRASRSRSRVA